jgi:hypothetical protein
MTVCQIADVEAIGEQLVEQGAARSRSADHEDRWVRKRFLHPAPAEVHLDRAQEPDARSADARSHGANKPARQRAGHGYS